MKFRLPEGTADVLPDEAARWRKLEDAARDCFARYGYEEIRTPVFEYTALFHKSSGETTDIVEKEMYTFGNPNEKDGTFSLRPELTPGTIRALLEQNLLAKKNFWKLWYWGPAFRKERPQKGRFRQFTQVGVEAIGSAEPGVDAETMILFADLLGAAGISKWELRINSIGCGECRGGYRDALRAAIQPQLPGYCENCRRRFERNVFRVLDCKVEGCAKLSSGLPTSMDHACGKCREHMGAVDRALTDAGVPHRTDPRLVRGLDYYTRTVYEFTSSSLGAQNALCGGGRYDTLVRDMGGPDVGSVGFAAGVERLLLAMEAPAAPPAPCFFGVAVAEEQRAAVFRAVTELRRAGLAGDMNFEGRSLKAQMRSANRSGARWALLIGPEEAGKGLLKVKDMKEGVERAVTLEEAKVMLLGGKRS